MSIYSGATVGWLALSAALAGLVAYELSDDAPLAPAVTAATIEATASVSDDRTVTSVDTPSLDLLEDIVGRPLFSASRRPVETVIEDRVPAVDIPTRELSLELVGTMLSGNSRVVLLKHPTEGLLRLRRGQTVEGWEIGEIDHNLVELKNGDEVERLKLRTDLLAPKRPGRQGPNLSGQPNRGEGKAAEVLRAAKGQPAPLAQQ